MKLLLTSSGLDNGKVRKKFLEVLGKNIQNKNVLFIFGTKNKEELFYVTESKKELIDLGILKKNIIDANINKKIDITKLEKVSFDLIYFCGGNTYYLLDRIKKLKLDKLIKNLFDKGALYLGVSAGSIIAGKSIEIAGWGSEGDKNEVGLKDLTGLNFTNIAIFPHYHDELSSEIKEFSKKVNYPVRALKNTEAILILGNKIGVIKCPHS